MPGYGNTRGQLRRPAAFRSAGLERVKTNGRPTAQTGGSLPHFAQFGIDRAMGTMRLLGGLVFKLKKERHNDRQRKRRDWTTGQNQLW